MLEWTVLEDSGLGKSETHLCLNPSRALKVLNPLSLLSLPSTEWRVAVTMPQVLMELREAAAQAHEDGK